MKWEEILEASRNQDYQALGKLGKFHKAEHPPQEGVTDAELAKQIASLGSKDHPNYKRLTREAYERWGQDQPSQETSSKNTSQSESSTNSSNNDNLSSNNND